MNLQISEQLQSYVAQTVEQRGYADVNEYVSDLILFDRQREQESLQQLRAELQKGLDSGICEQSIDEIFDEVLADLDED